MVTSLGEETAGRFAGCLFLAYRTEFSAFFISATCNKSYLTHPYPTRGIEMDEPEDQWFCIAHLSADDMFKSAVIEENKL